MSKLLQLPPPPLPPSPLPMLLPLHTTPLRNEHPARAMHTALHLVHRSPLTTRRASLWTVVWLGQEGQNGEARAQRCGATGFDEEALSLLRCPRALRGSALQKGEHPVPSVTTWALTEHNSAERNGSGPDWSICCLP